MNLPLVKITRMKVKASDTKFVHNLFIQKVWHRFILSSNDSILSIVLSSFFHLKLSAIERISKMNNKIRPVLPTAYLRKGEKSANCGNTKLKPISITFKHIIKVNAFLSGFSSKTGNSIID